MIVYVLEERDNTTKQVITYQITRDKERAKKWLWTKHIHNSRPSDNHEYNESRLYLIEGNITYRIVEQETI